MEYISPSYSIPDILYLETFSYFLYFHRIMMELECCKSIQYIMCGQYFANNSQFLSSRWDCASPPPTGRGECGNIVYCVMYVGLLHKMQPTRSTGGGGGGSSRMDGTGSFSYRLNLLGLILGRGQGHRGREGSEGGRGGGRQDGMKEWRRRVLLRQEVRSGTDHLYVIFWGKRLDLSIVYTPIIFLPAATVS